MKSLFLAVLIAMTLFAATSVAQTGPFTVTQVSNRMVVAVAGDISCVFIGPVNSDDLLINCFVGANPVPKFTESLRPEIGTCNTLDKAGDPGASEFGPTPDGNFISWSLCQPTKGTFTWSADADNQAAGSGNITP